MVENKKKNSNDNINSKPEIEIKKTEELEITGQEDQEDKNKIENETINELKRKEELWKIKCAELTNQISEERKRTTEAIKYGNKKILERIIIFLDGLERAIEAAKKTENAEEEKIVKRTILGFELVAEEFEKILIEQKVEKIKIVPKEEQFDPEKHQAISFKEDNNFPENTILTVLQNGYLIEEKVLRPAWVEISRTKKNEKNEQNN